MFGPFLVESGDICFLPLLGVLAGLIYFIKEFEKEGGTLRVDTFKHLVGDVVEANSFAHGEPLNVRVYFRLSNFLFNRKVCDGGIWRVFLEIIGTREVEVRVGGGVILSDGSL